MDGMSGGQQGIVKYIDYLVQYIDPTLTDDTPSPDDLFMAMAAMPTNIIRTAAENMHTDISRVQLVNLQMQPFVHEGTTRALVGWGVVLVHPLVSVPQMSTNGIILGGR